MRKNLDWVINQVKGFMSHLGYVAMKAVPDLYVPETLVEFDNAVRISADRRGPGAFGAGNGEIANLYFGYEKTWEARRAREAARGGGRGFGNRPTGGGRGRGGRGGGGSSYGPPKRGACVAWNVEKDGCQEANCDKHHSCIYCWDPTHKGPLCKDKNSTVFKNRKR